MTRQAHGALAPLVCLALVGCATPAARPVLLPLPSRPVLTPLKASDLQCLSDSAYTTIVNRERAYKTWGVQLEAIIEANNAKADGAHK